MKQFIQKLIKFPAYVVVLMINVYQHTLPPDHSWLAARFPYGYCRHYPTCSEYSKQSLIKFGLIKGLYLSIKRLLKCHPWADPKMDPVPS